MVKERRCDAIVRFLMAVSRDAVNEVRIVKIHCDRSQQFVRAPRCPGMVSLVEIMMAVIERRCEACVPRPQKAESARAQTNFLPTHLPSGFRPEVCSGVRSAGCGAGNDERWKRARRNERSSEQKEPGTRVVTNVRPLARSEDAEKER